MPPTLGRRLLVAAGLWLIGVGWLMADEPAFVAFGTALALIGLWLTPA